MKHIVLLFALLGSALSAIAQDDGVKAKLYVVRPVILENWNKEGAPPVANVTDAKLGDDLKVAIFFTGQARDNRGNGKVTYTITIETPKGEKFNFPNLVGAEGPMPKEIADQMYLGSATVSAKLPTNNPQLPAGKYKFSAVVKDNIGQREWTIEPVVIELK